MIPLQLRLKNFLSYGPVEQIINFEPYSLICLSGKNGHGKSSILDAITWAIWGCARKATGVSKSDEGLVHLGQKEMVVHLDFSTGGQRYRIRREIFKSNAKTVNRLDVELFDEVAQQFITLTDKSIRATQEKIERVVGVDFMTFVSTSFLRQGQSNEFSKKTPRERKDVIASIIGLKKFDDLAALSLEKSKEFSQRMAQFQFKVEHVRDLALQSLAIEEQLVNVKKKIEESNEQLELLAIDEQKIIQKNQKLQELSLQHASLLIEIESANRINTDKKTKTFALAAEWRVLHAKLIVLPSFEVVMQRRAKHLAQLDELRHKKEMMGALQEKLTLFKSQKKIVQTELAHEAQIKKLDCVRRKNEILTEQKYIKSTMHELLERKKQLDLACLEIKQKMTVIIDELAHKEQLESLYDSEKNIFEKRKSFYHLCVSKKNSAQSTIVELIDRRELVENVSSPSCPLCEQLLTLKRKQFLSQQLASHMRLAQHKLNRVSIVLKQLEEVLKAQRSQLEVTGKKCLQLGSFEQDLVRLNLAQEDILQELVVVENKIAALVTREKEQQTRELSLDLEIAHLDKNLQTSLESDERIKSLSSEIVAIEERMLEVNFNPEKMALAVEQLARIDQLLSDIQSKNTLFEQALKLKHHIFSEISAIRSARVVIEQKKQQAIRLSSELEIKNQLAAEHVEIIAKRTAITGERNQRATEQGSLIERKKKSDEAVILVDQFSSELNKLALEKKEYDFLAEAYGKNGIQALLIEEVLPEIEREANLLLSKLTDNQTQIFIESVRDLKSGGVRETLDIQISDSVGIRPYEMFSGGEAFRIDFALRIAVSKLLARRAGTHLQTLFIDEGFGSQDEEGLSLLTQALFSVQQEFEKIIIVSHLERLKDSFPVHLVVEKRSSGSFVHVEERG